MARLVLFALALLAAGGLAEPGKKVLPQKIGKIAYIFTLLFMLYCIFVSTQLKVLVRTYD